jgi:hypothetical protein
VGLSIRWYGTGEVLSKGSGLVLVSVSIRWCATSGVLCELEHKVVCGQWSALRA